MREKLIQTDQFALEAKLVTIWNSSAYFWKLEQVDIIQ